MTDDADDGLPDGERDCMSWNEYGDAVLELGWLPWRGVGCSKADFSLTGVVGAVWGRVVGVVADVDPVVVPVIFICAVLVAIDTGGGGRCGLKDTAFSESCSMGLGVGKILVPLFVPATRVSRDGFDPLPLPLPLPLPRVRRLSDELLSVLVLIAVGLENMDLYG